MKATVLLDKYQAWLQDKKLVPTFHVGKARTCIRYNKPETSPRQMVAVRRKGASRAFVHTMNLFEEFLEVNNIGEIENDIPTLGTTRKQFWGNETNRKRILKRYQDKKKEPPVSIPKINSLFLTLEDPYRQSCIRASCTSGFPETKRSAT